MKLFWYTIKRDKEQRGLEYVTPLSEALQFSNFSGSQSAMNISAVYRAVEIISDSCALLPLKIKINNKTHKDEVNEHPIKTVLNNGSLTRYNFIKLLIQSVLLKGNGFAYISRAEDGTVIDIRFLDSNDVQIHYNKNVGELYYTCNLVSNKKIEPCNMIHLVKNSYDGVNGLSVISYASRTVKISNNTENSANSFFNNGCNLAGILTVQGQLSQQQRTDIRNSWNQAYTNGGSGLAILQGNMDYKPVQVNASDAQLLESRQYNVQDIARFFGISPVLLGDLSHSNYNTIEAVQQQFILHTLQPYIVMIEEEFTRKLFKPSESNLEINLDETAILKTDKVAEANYYGSLLDKGILCVNEVREFMGLSPIDGGDVHTVAYTDINQNTINKQNKNTDEDGTKTNPEQL